MFSLKILLTMLHRLLWSSKFRYLFTIDATGMGSKKIDVVRVLSDLVNNL